MEPRARIGHVLPLVAALLPAIAACADLISDVTDLGSVEVEAVRLNGDPVPGVQLVLYTGTRPVATGTTDDAGRHVFDYLPPEAYGVYSEPPSGYLRPEAVFGGPPTAFRDGLGIQDGEHIPIRFEFMKEGPGSIRVTVHEPDGTPVPRSRLSAYGGGPGRQATTGPDGVAQIDSLPMGNWGVQAEPALEYRLPDGQLPYTHGIIIEDGVIADVEIVMDLDMFEPCHGRLEVTVEDQSGMPVGNFPVTTYLSWIPIQTLRTDPDGVAIFSQVPCRVVGVTLERMPGFTFEYGRGVSFYDGIEVTQGTDLGFGLVVERSGG